MCTEPQRPAGCFRRDSGFIRTAIIITLLVAGTAAAEPKIHVAPGTYNDYYHLRFELTPENCELTVPVAERRPKYAESNVYEFSKGGQFEVFIRKQAFPVPAPHTDAHFLILRMPWTDPKVENARTHLSGKRQLFEAIRKMKRKGEGRVAVIVELNPYVTVKKKAPLQLELSSRNLFFRQAHGRYVDHLGPLRKDGTP